MPPGCTACPVPPISGKSTPVVMVESYQRPIEMPQGLTEFPWDRSWLKANHPYIDPMPECVFCKSLRTMTVEHVLPQWIGDELQILVVLKRTKVPPVSRCAGARNLASSCVRSAERAIRDGWRRSHADPFI